MKYPNIETSIVRGDYTIPVSVQVIGRIMAGEDESTWTPDLGECVVDRPVYVAAFMGTQYYEGEILVLTDAEREQIIATGTEQYEQRQQPQYEPEF